VGDVKTKLIPAALLGHLVQVRQGEATAMLWSFAYFFCLLCGYYILRPVRDEMGIQGGVENLQWLFTGTFLTMLAAVPLFGWVSSRYPRRKFLPFVYLFFVANLLIFYVLLQFRIAPTTTAQAFFIWVSVFNLFVVSVFWSFMADLYRNEQARRLFGFISAGGSLGALAGPTVTAMLAPATGPANLLPLSACLLLMAVLCIYRLAGRVARNPGEQVEISRRAAEQPIGGNIFAGVTAALKSPYLLGIGVYIVLGTVLGTFLYFHQAYIVSMAISDSGSRTALFAQIDLAVNALTLACQLFVVNRLIARFGIGTTLMVLPVLAAVGFFLIGLAPTLTVLVAFQVLRRAGEYAIARPAREILFTVLNREEKYKSKNFIDTVVFRGGDAVSGWLFEGLRILGLGFSGIAFVGVPIALLWAGTGWMLGRTQEDMRKTQEWRRRTDAPETDQAAAPQNSAGTGGMGSVGGDGQPVVR
jgi:AAA family ATP:ADP antiporter